MKNLVWVLALGLIAEGCSLRLPAAGLAGKYQVGRSLVGKPRGEGASEAIPYLEEVAKKDPYYKDTLTLLGRAYYHRKRYQEAFWVLQKALEVNRKDEVAWMTLGITQFQLNEDEKGFESLKTGLALLNNASRSGYRGYFEWDRAGVVKDSIRKTIVQVAEEGLDAKERLIRSTEVLLARLDNEERSQHTDSAVERTIQRGDE